MKGKFIVFEGSDGSGKSSVLKKVREYLEDNKYNFIITREPGGTEIGEKIREILLNSSMNDRTEALLFAAARSESVEQVLKPSLENKELVISDRYVLSSLAYQGYARELGVEKVKDINDFATDFLVPDYVFFLDVDPITVLNRKKKSVEADRLESESENFHKKVYEGYKSLVRENSIIVIDASLPLDEVVENTINKLKEILEDL